ncbi:hypothetical protein YpMG051020_1002 [Yersinia pestis biovar Orientalis str. MG05-1020]|nr:hypothetical protein YpF1991016_2570 [Yersinia pestis biovar Orientalis str. F1991016]EDR56451.1 hypothetical protein YpMG051020_1002 [Yersinia pestis biovar Orientalis str. MG05-1020]EDR62692.1 hypothetical protein YpUG050454_0880 [Yersinia pestis biovar Antiqua str. UG05-0454]
MILRTPGLHSVTWLPLFVFLPPLICHPASSKRFINSPLSM